MEPTGVAPGLFYMPGYAHLIRALRSSRGDHRVRDPDTLFKCEICPSLQAKPLLRVRQRRFIGVDCEAGVSQGRLRWLAATCFTLLTFGRNSEEFRLQRNSVSPSKSHP